VPVVEAGGLPVHACVALTREVMVMMQVVVARSGHLGEGRPHARGGQRAARSFDPTRGLCRHLSAQYMQRAERAQCRV